MFLGRETLEDHSQLPNKCSVRAVASFSYVWRHRHVRIIPTYGNLSVFGQLQAFRMYGSIGMSASFLHMETFQCFRTKHFCTYTLTICQNYNDRNDVILHYLGNLYKLRTTYGILILQYYVYQNNRHYCNITSIRIIDITAISHLSEKGSPAMLTSIMIPFGCDIATRKLPF